MKTLSGIVGLITLLIPLLGHANAWWLPKPTATITDQDIKSWSCPDCHGRDGLSPNPQTPVIASMPVAHLRDVMQQFNHKERPSTITAHHGPFSDDQILQFAVHYNQQKWQSPQQTVNPTLARQGADLIGKCNRCHEKQGYDQTDDQPRLAGQRLDYLLSRLDQFKTNNTAWPMPKKMRSFIKERPHTELIALMHFYASLR
ncbi:MAG: hypothetical protein HQL54_13185 [Magnetococcales bacterium]|nr:hypothetical protein [Magnetococcales bacterium]